MIKLDIWESQFVYLSKNWFSYDPKKYLMSEEEKYGVAKKIWAERCGIELEYVQIKDINYFLIKLCKKFELFDNIEAIIKFIQSLSPFDKYSSETEVTINKWQWAMKIFSACMMYLQMSLIRNRDKFGNVYDIIHLENLETKFIMVEPDKEAL